MAVDARATVWHPQRAVNTLEVLKPMLNCSERALRFVSLRERGGRQYCANSRRKFAVHPMSEFL
jgi:hypothetical protein